MIKIAFTQWRLVGKCTVQIGCFSFFGWPVMRSILSVFNLKRDILQSVKVIQVNNSQWPKLYKKNKEQIDTNNISLYQEI